MTVVAALGDSFTCGEGVGVQVDPDATWVALLTAALPGGQLLRLAEPGARIVDVRTRQVPRLPEHVDLVTLVVGLNDVARAGFEPAAAAAQLAGTIVALAGRADMVLLGRLHDPTALLPLPARVADRARQRLALVNAAVDTAAGWSGCHVLDLGRVPALRQRGGWAVDRVHPGPAGHRAMAAAAVEVVRADGRLVPSPVVPVSVPRGPSRRASGWWAIRHGLPYVAGHLRDIGAPVASALLRRD